MNCRHMIDDHHGRGVGGQPCWSERWTGFSARTGKDPDRLSFIRSLRVIRRQVTDQAGFSPRPAG